MGKMEEAYHLYKSRGGELSKKDFESSLIVWVWAVLTESKNERGGGLSRLCEMIDELGNAYLKTPEKYEAFETRITHLLS